MTAVRRRLLRRLAAPVRRRASNVATATITAARRDFASLVRARTSSSGLLRPGPLPRFGVAALERSRYFTYRSRGQFYLLGCNIVAR